LKQLPLPLGVDTPRGFETYLGDANAAAIEQLRAVRHAVSAVTSGTAPAPTYLWGASGSGKTHLLQALVQDAGRHGLHAACFDAGRATPWTVDDGCSLAVIDDCAALDAAQQHAAFTVFVDAATRGVAVVAAGRLPPVDLPLREDLRTRLGWGHVHALTALGEDGARAALRRESDRRGIPLGDDVMDYLLTRFERNLKQLMAQLDRLDVYALATKRPITVPLLKQMLADERSPAPLSPSPTLPPAETP
jgi:DnaA-homolog protein